MQRQCSALILLLALYAPVAWAAPDERGGERPKIGLVLSGGGARGGAHVGVLKVLEELRIPVDYVAGTSVGSIVGGLYCSGLSPDQIEDAFSEIDWDAAFEDAPGRRNLSFRRKEDDDQPLFPFEFGVSRRGFSFRSGLIAGQQVNFILRRMTLHTTAVQHFDELRLPFRAVAADLDNGEMVLLDRGDLAEAMRASMAVPGAFTPVERDGKFLVDGGIANNLPVDVVQSMGADRIIAVDVGTYSKGAEPQMSALGVVSRTILLLSNRNVQGQKALLDEDDVIIVPELDAISSASFNDAIRAIDLGESAARQLASKLADMSLSEEAWNRYLERQRLPRVEQASDRIRSIRVEGGRRIDEALVKKRMRTREGEPLFLRELQRDLERIYQMGEFESVDFRLVTRDGGQELTILVKEKPWGPRFLRIGIEVESNLDGDSDFAAVANFRWAGLNSLGAEWKTVARLGDPLSIETELYQPVDRRGTWFVAPSLTLSRDNDDVFVVGDALESVQSDLARIGLDVGAPFRNWGELRIGGYRGTFEAEQENDSAATLLDVELGGWALKATIDQLDSAYFPGSGYFGEVRGRFSRQSLGADDAYDKLSVRFLQAGSSGENRFLGKLEIGSSLGSEIPVYDDFRLGGFLRLSGFQRDSLQGDVSGLATFAYYRRLMGLGPLGRGLYTGAAVQAGNVWDDLDAAELGDLRFSGTLFVGADTLLAPIYVGVGWGEGGRADVYLFVGKLF